MSTPEPVAESDEHAGAAASRPLEIAFALVALAVTAGYLYLGTQIPLRQEAAPGQIDARFWPLLLGTAGVAVSVALLAIAITRPPQSRDDIERIQPGGVLRVVLTCALTLGYVGLWILGSVVAFGYRIELFPVITAAYLVLLMLLYGQRRWLGLVLYPVAVTVFIYVLFGMLLRVPL